MTKPLKALFLGAGASFDFGMPLVWELTAELKRWLPPAKLVAFNQKWRAKGAGWTDRTVSVVISLLTNSNMHYEQIIGAIEVEYSRAYHDPKQQQDFHSALGFLLQAVRGLLLERQIKNCIFADSVLDDFSAIKHLAEENQPLWIFSTNHDVIVEMMAAKFDIPLKTGFKDRISLNMDSGAGLVASIAFDRLSREAIVANDYDFFRPGEKGINLIKLHGAIDIFGQGDELNYLKLVVSKDAPKAEVSPLYSLERICLALAKRDGVYAINEYTYLDSEGVIQFLRHSILSGAHKFSPNSKQIAPPEFMSLFMTYLNYASELVCIGYSFGDRHINRPITDWLAFRGDRKLLIVNPGINSCPEVVGHLNAQITLRKISARQYFVELSRPLRGFFGLLLRFIQNRNRARSMRKLLDPVSN